MNKLILPTIATIGSGLLLATILFLVINDNDNESSQESRTILLDEPPQYEELPTYALFQVEEKDSSAGCWIYSGETVYELTEFISTTESDLDIEQYCGSDGTELVQQIDLSEQIIGSLRN